jgi:tetratricopeptide (TPR) repeat protein
MKRILALLTIGLLAAAQVIADDEAAAKTVLGPKNIYLADGANALMAGDAEEGVRLTLMGLKIAQGQREEKVGHSNLCAGFLLLGQAETALEHCNWVLELDPYHWRTYNNRALVYLRLERFQESEADIRRGQELNPKSEKLKEVKGLYLDKVVPVEERITIDDRRKQPETPVENPQQ